MCGRYRLTAKERYLRDHFGLDEDPTWTPRWKIAPTRPVPIVRQKSVSSTRSFDLVSLGPDSFLGQRSLNRDENHQCYVGNGGRKACIPGCTAPATLSHPGQQFL